MKRTPLYIETEITCDIETLWQHTQDPAIHEQWDLRFSTIRYIPKAVPSDPQQFLYSTNIGLGIAVCGTGESVATKTSTNGESTSVLKFASEHTTSIIKEGSGYWKYIPTKKGMRFLTGYNYETRWGVLGKLIDKYMFRPFMSWATAWSFDRLKNWIEKGVHPKQALIAQLSVFIANLTLGIIWVYQGLVPKLLFPETGEVDIIMRSGLFSGNERTFLAVFGSAEILFGILFLFFQRKFMHHLNIAGLLLLTLGAIVTDMSLLLLPLNPFSLNLAMIAISIIALVNFDYAPKASNCITKEP